MGTSLRYRLFRIGRMPAALKTAAASSELLAAAEGVSIKVSARSVRMPGVRAGRAVSLVSGAVVVLPNRLLASVGRYPVLDTDFRANVRPGQTLTLSEDGVHIHIDVESVFDGCSGTVEMHYRVPLGPTVLARVAATNCSVSLSSTAAMLLPRWV